MVSVGLDQRVRCWDLALPRQSSATGFARDICNTPMISDCDEHVNKACESVAGGRLHGGAVVRESGWCVSDVPEVENLDVCEAAEGR